jgi:acylphosphatase
MSDVSDLRAEGGDVNGGDRTRLSALIHGRVQGVGYRMFADDHAHDLGLDGYVRNLPDGRTVEVVAEGPREALEEFLTVLRRGPYAARVDRVDTSWGPALGNLGPFAPRP